MALDERTKLAAEGLVVAAVEVDRRQPTRTAPSEPDSDEEPDPVVTQARLRGRVRITSRALWIDKGRLLEQLHKVDGRSHRFQYSDLSRLYELP